MSKKLFIFLFLLIALPVFADDNPFRDDVINELPPELPAVQTTADTNKTTFSHKVKGIFHKENKNLAQQKAKEIAPATPEKTIESVKKEHKKQKKQNKKNKKTQQSDIKNSSNIKELNNMIDDAQKNYVELPAVSQENYGKTLTNTAYQGSVDTTRIIEVNDCVKIALENHPLIRYAMSNAEVYQSKIAQAWSNYFPTFSAGISLTSMSTAFAFDM